MKNTGNNPTHITKGDIFDELGLSPADVSALKVKAKLLDAVLREIKQRGYTQRQLVELLDEYQPSVSNLVRGKIASVSIEKLLRYSDRLHMKATLTIRAISDRERGPAVERARRSGTRSLSDRPGVRRGSTKAIA